MTSRSDESFLPGCVRRDRLIAADLRPPVVEGRDFDLVFHFSFSCASRPVCLLLSFPSR